MEEDADCVDGPALIRQVEELQRVALRLDYFHVVHANLVSRRVLCSDCRVLYYRYLTESCIASKLYHVHAAGYQERDEKQHALEVLMHRVEGLQYEMDEKVDLVEILTRRVEELQRERDELRKDIEQLCMQQAGPGYISVATRILSQRTAALEQDIENLQKKLGGCLRENQNLQEELAEAYRVKSQLAELHGAELSKNKDLEKQVRFFQSSVAQAFAERDNSIMECEKVKQREEAVLKKFADFEERTREYQSAIDDQKHLNDGLQRELTELKAQTESSLKRLQMSFEHCF